MADSLAQARQDLAIANRIVSVEGIIDAFGHVSMRHPTKPDRYLISRSRSPEVVEASDIYEYTLDSKPVTPLPDGIRGYGELVIHGEIYKARPDVNAVAHHHGMAFLPFCNSGEELVPLYHMGAQIGPKVPFWDSRDEFGDTCLLVLKPEEGRSLGKGARPVLAGADATPRRDRRRQDADRARVPHHLQLSQRRTSTDGARARPSAEPADAGRGQARLGAQSRAAAAGTCVGILEHPAAQGRRISAGAIQDQGEGARPVAPSEVANAPLTRKVRKKSCSAPVPQIRDGRKAGAAFPTYFCATVTLTIFPVKALSPCL